MIRIKNTKSIICSNKELKMILDLDMVRWYNTPCFYELPLFSMQPKTKRPDWIDSDYILIRPCGCSYFSESFFNKVNKTWNELYESWY